MTRNVMTWQAAECPFAIEYPAAVLDEIRRAAVDAFFAFPHGGAEIGGVLFGAYDSAGVRIMTFRPIECEHLNGPRFLLSEKDQEHLQAFLHKCAADPALRGLAVVGWYHSHTRSGISMCARDLEIYNRFFPESWHVALVVRPDGLKPARAGFFFREANGEVHSEATYREFVMDGPGAAEPLPPAPPLLPPAAPPRRPEQRVEPPALRASTPPPAASQARWTRRTIAIAAALGGLLLAGALTCAESALAARMVVPKQPAAVAPRPVVAAALPALPQKMEDTAELAPPTPEPLPAPKAQPKLWAGLRPVTTQAGPAALPQAPAAEPDVPAPPAANWDATPIAAAPRRVAFEDGSITFFADSVAVTDRKHPRGLALPTHGLNYSCESKTESCTIAAGTARIRMKHASDYKMLVEYLTQAR